MGIRVPVATSPVAISAAGTSPTTGVQYQYENVGTNIDVDATNTGMHLYRLRCTVERTAVSSSNEEGKLRGLQALAYLPILTSFNSRFELSLHDGESGEATSATDPLSGNLMKVDVTIHVLK